MRVRYCLAEAIREGEFTLTHRAGTRLWADALTKCLPVAAVERFCEGVGLKKEATVKCLLAVVSGLQVKQMQAMGQLVLIGGVAALAQKVRPGQGQAAACG